MTSSNLIKKNSKRAIYRDFLIGGLILLSSILPYIHDAIPKGMSAGISGYSSLRVFLFVVLINLFGLIGWVIAYFEARGKRYRFVIIVPIINITYQVFIYILNLKKTSFNDLNLKFIITFTVSLLVFLFYFLRKIKKNKQ
jgi:hypothetical protein